MLDQCHDETADLVVKMRDASIVSDLCLARQLRVDRTCLRVEDPSVPLQVFVGLPVSDERRAQLLVLIQVKIVLRSVKRRMGP